MSGLLGYFGAAAGGAADGLAQRQQMETQQRDMALRELMAGLQQRAMQRDDEPAPPEFLRGAEQFAPGANLNEFAGSANRREIGQFVGGFQQPGVTKAGKDYDRELDLINARGDNARKTRAVAPGRQGDPDLANKQIDRLLAERRKVATATTHYVLQMLQSMNPEMAAKLASAPPDQLKIETIKFLDARIRSYGYDPNSGAPLGGAAQAAPQPSPVATPAAGEVEYVRDPNTNAIVPKR